MFSSAPRRALVATFSSGLDILNDKCSVSYEPGWDVPEDQPGIVKYLGAQRALLSL